jgi:hypothetical protein
MQRKPYDDQGVLKPQHLKELEQDFSNPVAVSPGTATGTVKVCRLVKGLETSFKFSVKAK